MLRVLYLSFAVRYINPTTELMLSALLSACRLDVYGPGFQSPADLARNPGEFVERHGPYDLILADEFTIQNFDQAPSSRPLRFVNHACRFDRGMMMYGQRFQEFLANYRGRKGIILLQTDYHNIPEKRLRAVQDHFHYVIGWGPELIAPKDAVVRVRERSAGLSPVDHQIIERWTDRYRDFLLDCPERVISFPHVVAEAELSSRPLRRRRYPWVVVGSDYTERIKARQQLDAAGLPRSGRALPYLFAGFQRIEINPYAHYWSIALLQRQFRASLTAARYGYTCGSVAKMAIRKYFEIPAAGCVLAADRCQGFEALGFRDGENAIVATGVEVAEVHRWLSDLGDQGQAIADAGQELIRAQHTVSARSRQLSAVFTAIADGRFAGSRWRDGAFELITPGEKEARSA